MEITIRPARDSDAEAACQVVRRSIQELCVADHRDDPQILADWLANKTPETIRAWILAHVAIVAVRGQAVCGFALMTAAGEIQLCYVAPEVRFLGVSARMLQALEEVAVRRGLQRVFLISTLTARAFYERRGYRPDAGPVTIHGMDQALSMSKRLAGPPAPASAQ